MNSNSEENNNLQQALLETIRQNSRLLDELQAARQREQILTDRYFQLEEILDNQRGAQSHNTGDSNDLLNDIHKKSIGIHNKKHACRHHTDEENSNKKEEEEWVEWKRIPRYEVIVNRNTTVEAFVAINSSVCFIRNDVVQRAGLMPQKLNSVARFKCFGSDQPMVVTEVVNVPIQIAAYHNTCLMFVSHIQSEIILGASWLQSEHVYWNVNWMLIGPNKIRVDPKPPVMIKKTDPRTTIVDEPVIIERLN
ncbi:hypothetical protein BDC45DRAFT_518597 [Circinella umbellata]|nr:hypothetical protein BDC45DRAFT_518597 [Circinella umbellata]